MRPEPLEVLQQWGVRRGRMRRRRVRIAWAAARTLGMVGALAGIVEGQTPQGTTGDTILVSEGTRPALEIPGPLPELSRFLPDGIQSQAGVDWIRSWEVGAAQGRRLRSAVYLELRKSGLSVDSAGAQQAVSSVEAALASLDEVPAPLPLHLSLSVSEASRLAGDARRAFEARRWSDAALQSLQAGDALREVMPRTVALTLIEAGEVALRNHIGRPETNELVTGVTVEAARRAARLLQWARSGIAAGNEWRAIQRAYYACRLLGVVLP